MSIGTHIESLKLKHQELESKIHDAYIHHQPTAELKKQKLLIKEQIEQYLSVTELSRAA